MHYSTGLFDFFNENKSILLPLLSAPDRERLTSLVKDQVLAKVDPATHGLTITSESEGGGCTYTISSAVAQFRGALASARALGIDVTAFRNHIINFIPFAYADDLTLILNECGPLSSSDLEPVLAVYRERRSDLWRHMPGSLIEAVERYRITEALPVLRAFVTEPKCTPEVRRRALIAADTLIPDADSLNRLFSAYMASRDPMERDLAETCNALLVGRHADAAAVRWRLGQLRRRMAPFTPPEGAHTVGVLEEELTAQPFAAPLLQLQKVEYQREFLSLLDYAMGVWARGKEYQAYASYLWTVVYAYFDNLKVHGSYEPLKRLEGRIADLKESDGANWMAGRMVELRRSYLRYLGKPVSIGQAVARYNGVRQKQAGRLTTAADLQAVLREALETDVRRWIEDEGAYSIILEKRFFKTKRQEYEKLVQRTLKPQIEVILLRRGFDVDPLREPQLLHGKRPDFLVRYGFAGPVVVEIKLGTNSDVRRKEFWKTKSFANMRTYMSGFGASHGLFVVLASPEEAKHIPGIEKAFEQLKDVAVVSFVVAEAGRPDAPQERRRPNRKGHAERRLKSSWKAGRRGRRPAKGRKASTRMKSRGK
jgi:hypothetical protein